MLCGITLLKWVYFDFTGAPLVSSVNIEASSAPPGDVNPNPKPPREQKGRGQRPPASKRGGGNSGGPGVGGGASALADGKQEKTLVNGTSA